MTVQEMVADPLLQAEGASRQYKITLDIDDRFSMPAGTTVLSPEGNVIGEVLECKDESDLNRGRVVALTVHRMTLDAEIGWAWYLTEG